MKKQVTFKNMLSFGIGDIYGGGAFFVIGSLFLVFLTDIVGLRASVAGAIILIGKVWDAITDPTMGYISDNTKSKRGRRRVYFLIGIVPIFISFALLWFDFSGSETGKFVYYLLVYLLFNTVFTMVMVPYNSLPAEMTNAYDLRSKMIGVRMLFSQIGMLLGAVLAKTIIDSFETEALGYQMMGIIFGLLYALPWIIVYKGTFEREEQVQVEVLPFKDTIVKLFKDFKSTFRNRSLRIHISMYLGAYVAMDIFMALFIYYLRDYLVMESSYQMLLGALVLMQILTLLVVVRECRTVGNAKTYRRHLLIWVVGIGIFALIKPASPLPYLLATSLVVGAGLSGVVMVPYNMLAFVVDADEMITQKRREGIYSGMMTFVRKIAQAMALFLVGVGIEAVGYQSSEASQVILQSESTINGIRFMFVAGPMILLCMGFLASFRFKISPTNHKIMSDEVNRLKEGGLKSNVTKETKNVVESITGLSYLKLWNNV